MKPLISFFIWCAFSQFLWGQSNITISLWFPHTYQLVDSNLYIQVFVGSTYPLSSVTANVKGRQTSLTSGGVSSNYTGTLSLSGLPEDTLILQIIATDIQNHQLIQERPFIYDLPPLLIVESPLSWSTATPLIHIKAKCIDSDGCKLTIAGPGQIYKTIYTGDSIDSTLDLSGGVGIWGSIDFIATDQRGQFTLISKQVLVENSPYLKPVYEATDQIMDFNYNKVLVTNPWWRGSGSTPDLNPYIYRSRIIDIITGDSTPIPYQGPLFATNVADVGRHHYLTPYGAIFGVVDTTTYLAKIMDWNNGSLYQLGALNSSLSIRTAGNNAIWSNGSKLYFRNLQTVTDTIISSSAGNWYNDVASNGLVAYWGIDNNIYRFSNNLSTKLTDNANNKWNVYSLTDGNNIVYSKHDPCCTNQRYALYLHNGQSDSLLSDMGTKEPIPHYNYQLNNKYLAYTKPDSAGNYHVWLRDTSGIHSQVTFSGTDNRIDFLNEKGDMTTTTNYIKGRRYLFIKATGQVHEIGSSLGRTYYRDGKWYWVLGRMLYKIDESLYPQKPLQPVIAGLKNIYCNNSGMQKGLILNLPDTSAGISVRVILDNVNLPINSDSSFSFNANSLVTGQHVIEVLYSNTIGTSIFTSTFIISAVVTPVVHLSSNISKATNQTDPVIITATNVNGGGNHPVFTFSSDRHFTNILQAEGPDNTLTIDPKKLDRGANWFYVRMKTSDPCFTVQTAVDNVLVMRIGKPGIIDPHFQNKVITVHPNPFHHSFILTGLDLDKTYLITIQNILGQRKYQLQVNKKETTLLNLAHLPDGNYLISIYDNKKQRLIGTLPVVKK